MLAALYLALVQILTVAHAASDEAAGPHHDPATCVLHVAADRMASALPEAGLVLSEAPVIQPVAGPDIVRISYAGPHSLPPPRGPPIP